jgi:hypothetical protein
MQTTNLNSKGTNDDFGSTQKVVNDHLSRLRYREVVVIVPTGNYNQPQELGRYMHESIARSILSVLNLPEYKMFFLDTGEEVLVH